MNGRDIKSRGNKTTEMRLRAALARARLRGYVTHARGIPGTPDVAFMREKVAVFADGCYWHGCPDHFRAPVTRRQYWLGKINRNRARDRRDAQRLSALGWKVFRLWEHDLSNDQEAGALIRLVGRAVDTASESLTFGYIGRPHHSVPDKLLWCGPCFQATIHDIKDLTGHGRYVSASCSVCGTMSNRLDGITIGRNGINGAGIE